MDPQPATKRRKINSDGAAQETGGLPKPAHGLTLELANLPGELEIFLPEEDQPEVSSAPCASDDNIMTTSSTCTTSSSQLSLDTHSDDSQDQNARPFEDSNESGECFYVNDQNRWKRANYFFSGDFLEIVYLEAGQVVTKFVDHSDYLSDRGVIGPAAVAHSKQCSRWEPTVPDGCAPTTFLLFPGRNNTPNLRLQFRKASTLVEFYEYWKKHICPVDPRMQESDLYKKMRGKLND